MFQWSLRECDRYQNYTGSNSCVQRRSRSSGGGGGGIALGEGERAEGGGGEVAICGHVAVGGG